MKLIIGLGNPGKKYENTRHNFGFSVVDEIVFNYNVQYKNKFNSLCAEFVIGNEKIIVIKPQTFMNLSGEVVKKFIDFFDISFNDMLVVFDDTDLNFGKIRLKMKSGSGGHNGIKSIINNLHGNDFLRIKLGVNNEYKFDNAQFVLAEFSKNEKKELATIISNATSIIDDFCKGVTAVDLMNKYN